MSPGTTIPTCEFSLFFLFTFGFIHILKNHLIFHTVVRFSQFKMFRWHISILYLFRFLHFHKVKTVGFHIKHKNPDTNSQCLKKYPKHTYCRKSYNIVLKKHIDKIESEWEIFKHRIRQIKGSLSLKIVAFRSESTHCYLKSRIKFW